MIWCINVSSAYSSIWEFLIIWRWNSRVELNALEIHDSFFVVPQNGKTLQFVYARTNLSKSDPVVANVMSFGIDHKIVALATQEEQSVDYFGFNVSDFSCDNREVVPFNLHHKWANIESSVDHSEAISFTRHNLENEQRCIGRRVRGLLQVIKLVMIAMLSSSTLTL